MARRKSARSPHDSGRFILVAGVRYARFSLPVPLMLPVLGQVEACTP
jgi:hypothetical protein